MPENHSSKRFFANRGRLVSLALAVIGIALALFTYDAQMEIDDIGETDDPVLEETLSELEDRRDSLAVSSVGFVFIGLFGFVILAQQSLPASVSNAQMVSAARTHNDLVQELALKGNAIYLPAKHALTREKVFVLASAEDERLPDMMTEDMGLCLGKDGSTQGMLVEPPGSALLNVIEEERKTSMKDLDLEAVEGNLQMLKHGLDLMRDFHLKKRKGKLVLRVEYDGLGEACSSVREEMPDTCRQIQCLGCSCILTAVTRATGKAVRVEEVDNSKDRVVFTLSTHDW
jgi:hypothetical protein